MKKIKVGNTKKNKADIRSWIVKIAIVGVLVVGLIVGVKLLLDKKIFTSRAAGETVNISFSPSLVNFNNATSATTNLVINAPVSGTGNGVAFARVVINFDPTEVKLGEEISMSDKLGTVVRKTTMAEANSKGEIDMVAGLNVENRDNAPVGVYNFATLKWSKVAQGDFNGNITVNNAKSQIVEKATTTALPLTSVALAYKFETPTPIPPTATRVPTIVPTSNPGMPPPPPPDTTNTSELTFYPTDDARILAESPTTTNSDGIYLMAVNSPAQNYVMKFNVSGINGRPVQEAWLNMYALNSAAASGGKLYTASHNNWTEENVTWNNAPIAVTPVYTFGPVVANNWYQANVLSAVKSDGVISFRGRTDASDAAGYASKESQYIPRLVVKLGAGGGGSSSASGGLVGKYYSGKYFEKLLTTRTDSVINFNWGEGSAGTGLPSNDFSVRWEGYVKAPVTGRVTFKLTSDDGIRFWFNGQRILSDWDDHSALTHNVTVDMVQGQQYPLKIEYYEHQGQAVVRMGWSYNGQTSSYIPSSYLVHN